MGVGRIDQTGLPSPVFTGQDRGDAGAVPADQLSGPGVFSVDATGHPVIGIGGDDPDLAAGAATGSHLARQPLTVRGQRRAVDCAHLPHRLSPPCSAATSRAPRVATTRLSPAWSVSGSARPAGL